MNRSKATQGVIFRVALTGICAALIEAVKLALAVLPNVEGVTLLTALFGYCFGWTGVLASVVFVTIEPLIYGYHTWVISYYLYWPLVAIIFMILGRKKVRNRIVLTAVAVLLTVWFGILTAVVDATFFFRILGRASAEQNFWHSLFAYYMGGIWFYIVQIICNAVVFPLLFRPLSELLGKLRVKFLGNSEKTLDKPEET